MDVISDIIERAKRNKKKIVLAEGTEERNLKAAEIALKENIAEIVLLGDEEEIRANAAGLNISKAEIINPSKSEKYDEYVEAFTELRKKKGMTIDKAKEIIKNPMYYGCMMVKENDADGLVSGAVHATADLLRPAFQIIRAAKDVKVVSSAFIMVVPNCTLGADGVLLYSDGGVIPNPTAEELACIAVSAAKTMRMLVGVEPIVAMLSYSTKGSAEGDLVDKVRKATALAKEMAPDLKLDGELQGDAALVESVASLKAPTSSVAGHANVLIFPDLQAGNISYKLTQRLAKAQAIGPLLQGLAKPVNDLSRGCNPSDIVAEIAITSVEAQYV